MHCTSNHVTCAASLLRMVVDLSRVVHARCSRKFLDGREFEIFNDGRAKLQLSINERDAGDKMIITINCCFSS